ncbi:MAG: glycosyltransferase [Lachnospiraceae bacterium]|nr:glycosyltransferase [Lachnospiraceae bacterium]
MNKMKKRMLLITHGFPFGENERGFICEEFAELKNAYEISILSCGTDRLIKYSIPDLKDIQIEQYDYKINSFMVMLQILNADVWKEIIKARKNCKKVLFFRRIRSILSYNYKIGVAKKEIEKIIRNTPIDLIYTYWGTEELVAALRIKKKFCNMKVITRFHGYDLYLERQDTYWQPFQKYKAEHCDNIFFVSEAGRDYFNREWGSEEKSEVSYLGTPCVGQIRSSISDTLIMVSCSNLIELKRVDLIIEALSSLPEDIKVYWHHIGDGIESSKLQKMSMEKFLSKTNIQWKFWGYIPNKDIKKVYQDLMPHLFITTSSSEGLPVSVQEAFAMGIPAIGTDVGGMAELIKDQKTGFLLNSNPTIKEVSDAIEKFYNMSIDKKKKMCDLAYRMWSFNFNAEKNARYFVKAIDKILER